MRTIRRESRAESASHSALLVQQAQKRTGAETARMREKLTELATDREGWGQIFNLRFAENRGVRR